VANWLAWLIKKQQKHTKQTKIIKPSHAQISSKVFNRSPAGPQFPTRLPNQALTNTMRGLIKPVAELRGHRIPQKLHSSNDHDCFLRQAF